MGRNPSIERAVNYMENKSCGFGSYNKLSYRICYGLTEDGKMDFSIPLYEFKKYCKCETCSKRLKYDKEPSNSLTVTTDDKNKFPEIEKIINDYMCGSSNYIGHKYISMKNGETKEQICK